MLVLSLFPGIGLLDRAFEGEGFCIVRGPDLLWGGDVRSFHPPAGVFNGIIGGPPCQCFSQLRRLNPLAGQRHGNMIPEFERVVAEAQPHWFLMENVREAPEPHVEGYIVHSQVLNNRWLGEEQHRLRRFSFGTPDGRRLLVDVALFEAPLMALAVTGGHSAVPVKTGGSGKLKARLRPPTVVAGNGAVFGRETYSLQEMCQLQGLPTDFADEFPFTVHGKRKVIGNGVPLPMGRAIARAVRMAMGDGLPTELV